MCISFIGESDSEILFRKEPLLGKDKKDTSVSPYMTGRLRQNLATWRRTTQDSFVLSVIDSGYKIDWNHLGPPPPKYSNNSPNCANHLEFINSSIAEAQAMGVICEIPEQYITAQCRCEEKQRKATAYIQCHVHKFIYGCPYL